jgi:hypothetical protein
VPAAPLPAYSWFKVATVTDRGGVPCRGRHRCFCTAGLPWLGAEVMAAIMVMIVIVQGGRVRARAFCFPTAPEFTLKGRLGFKTLLRRGSWRSSVLPARCDEDHPSSARAAVVSSRNH